MTEIVLVPPTSADISALALLADIQYLELMSSEALNRKFNGIVPPGIYRGYEYTLPGGMGITIGANTPAGTAVVERSGCCITVQQAKPVSLVVPAAFSGYLVLEAIYGVGVITKQVSSTSNIDAASIKLVAKADLQSHHVILYTINTPAGTTTLLDSHISAEDRMEVSLAGSSSVDGGRYLNTPTGCVTIQMRRGLAADLSSYLLMDGEFGFTTDTERLAIGRNSRRGGLLLPASKWSEAAGVTAKPQGAYRFSSAGTLKLPASAETGEHVRVSVTPAAIISSAECLVVAEDGGAITTRAGDALAIAMDVSTEFVFVKTSTGWRY